MKRLLDEKKVNKKTFSIELAHAAQVSRLNPTDLPRRDNGLSGSAILMALTLQQIAEQYEIITAEIRFLTTDEGGRQTSIDLTLDALYRPHFVVQDRTVREAKMDGTRCAEPYVAMTFIDGPAGYENGDSGIFRFYCPYWTHPDHPEMNIGMEFTIREGGRIVAGGKVIENQNEIRN